MNISKQLRGQIVELKIDGRLDGYWADHLAAVVDQEIRDGSHHILLDLSGVPFLSSAGIGVLVRFYKDLKSINGSFAVFNCSRTVLKVLELSKLNEILVLNSPLEPVQEGAQQQSSSRSSAAPKQIERSGAIYEVYPLTVEARLNCTRVGNAELLERCGFAREHCRTMQFPESSFAIGLGALGDDFEDCQKRFGEFIAV